MYEQIIEETRQEMNARKRRKTRSVYLLPGIEREEDNIARFIDIVCRQNGTNREEIKEKGKKTELVEVRFIIAYLLAEYFDVLHREVARIIGRDHATVSHALKKCPDYNATDPRFKRKFDRAENEARKYKKGKHGKKKRSG